MQRESIRFRPVRRVKSRWGYLGGRRGGAHEVWNKLDGGGVRQREKLEYTRLLVLTACCVVIPFPGMKTFGPGESLVGGCFKHANLRCRWEDFGWKSHI
jgi:hypothetical protein